MTVYYRRFPQNYDADNYAVLRTRVGKAGAIAHCYGRSTAGDGGEGAFTWHDGTAKTDDDGTVLAVFVGGVQVGYWERAGVGDVDPRWFGADLSGVADNSAIFNSVTSVLTAIGGGRVVFRAGTYKIATNGTYFNVAGLRVILVFDPGAKFLIEASSVLIYGEVVAGAYQEVFSLSSTYMPTLYPGTGALNNPGIRLNPYWFGAKGDNTTDDTLAWQRCLDQASGVTAYNPNGKSARPATFSVPSGNFRITSTLYLTGTNRAILWKGFGAADINGSDTLVRWDGAFEGTLLLTQGLVNSRFERISFEGGSAETYDSTGAIASGGGTGASYLVRMITQTTGVIFEHCSFNGTNTTDADGAMVAMGEIAGPGSQVDDVMLLNCKAGKGRRAFAFLEGANVLNVSIVGGQYGLGKVVDMFDFSFNEGVSRVRDVFIAAVSGTIFKCGSKTLIEGIRAECEQFGTSQNCIIASSSGANKGRPGASLSIRDSDFYINRETDNWVVQYEGGSLNLDSVRFYNQNSIVGSTKQAWILGFAKHAESSVTTEWGSIRSRNCFYHRVTDVAPIYDGSAQRYLFPQDGVDVRRDAELYPYGFIVSSEGDVGGAGVGNDIVPLRPARNYIESLTMLQPGFPRAFDANFACNKAGFNAKGTTVVTVGYQKFQAAALTADYEICNLWPGDKIVHCEARVTAAFAGPAGTLVLRLGTSSGSDDLLLDTDVKTAAIDVGSSASHLGASLTTAVQGGFIPSRTGKTSIYARLASSSGNLSGLSAGSVSFLIVIERVL